MGARSSQSRGPGLNETDGHLLEYFRNTFASGGGGNSGPNIPVPPSGLTATGGVISDYTSPPGDIYRAHVFTSTDTFDVTALGTYGANVEYLAVAGGGGGAVGSDFTSYQSGGGGGGAGGLLVSPGFPGVPTSQNQGTAMAVSAGPTSYTITIGAGGVNGFSEPSLGTPKSGKQGHDSVLSGPDITTITAKGGGGGAGNPVVAQGGSGYGFRWRWLKEHIRLLLWRQQVLLEVILDQHNKDFLADMDLQMVDHILVQVFVMVVEVVVLVQLVFLEQIQNLELLKVMVG